MSSMKLKAGATEKVLSPGEQQGKGKSIVAKEIGEIRKIIGPIADKFPALFSDASILRYLIARNWNTKKAAKMMRETLKWRLEYKPEKIRWDDIAHEAMTGRLYKADFLDKQGRTVLVMRAGVQSTSSPNMQIKYLVYCLENAILNQSSNQEQMVWLVDFQGWSKASISLKVTRETAQLVQNHYPERLAYAILYNPPKLFESFWTMVKPFLENKTYKKVRFVYPDNPKSRMIMEEIFDMNRLDSCFGGKSSVRFNTEAYAKKCREEDKKMSTFAESCYSSPSTLHFLVSESQMSESTASDDNDGCEDEFSCDETVCSNMVKADEILQGQAPSSKDDRKECMANIAN
ncbi:random slug protein 5-like [Senna tora]|uniref:Random slug protein 5-like n=1 Tax=Senna tora TaxID=362788 RepID=A0A834TBX7_9FABA|nr:random slug protein 5-like [Senna tora]